MLLPQLPRKPPAITLDLSYPASVGLRHNQIPEGGNPEVTLYKIKTKRGVRIEGIDRKRMESRLAEVRKHDKTAKIITIPSAR